jgi:hypothetical protein
MRIERTPELSVRKREAGNGGRASDRDERAVIGHMRVRASRQRAGNDADERALAVDLDSGPVNGGVLCT